MNKHIIPITIIFLLLSSSFVGLSFNTEEAEVSQQTMNDGLMDSAWPMYCHDVRNTGRSPYSTADNLGVEKWRFTLNGWGSGSPVIDADGTIYIGAHDFYAIYPNGTLKWKYNTPYMIVSAPAIDENGVIYIGTIWAIPNYLFAFYSNGTLKWKYETGDSIYSSPVVGEDGTIYFGDCNYYVNALFPNGTLKWRYRTNHMVYSSPAIGQDGTVYCGSHDSKLYALYPNNGTLKWSFDTGDWVARGPTIADDDTIYFGSWDGYLYAVYPNGTLRWKRNVGTATTPITGQDGTIYVGSSSLKAVYPNNGTVKWSFDLGSESDIRGGNPAISADGTIYFGTHIGASEGGEIIAVNSDGTEKWRKMIATDWIMSAPAIGEDGTIYIGSVNDLYHPGTEGYLHAIGPGDMKKFEIIKPELGKRYIFGINTGSTLLGNVFIFGSCDVDLKVYSTEEVTRVNFYIDDIQQYTDEEAPFEWRINRRFFEQALNMHRMTVIANYNEGCQWIEELSFLYLHLRNN